MRQVIVVGAGNAGLSAALAAREMGAPVTVLERAPHHAYGSNSFFTGGLFRVAYDDISQLDGVLGDRALKVAEDEEVRRYSAADFLGDWGRVTAYRCDPELSEKVVVNSLATIEWLARAGVEFQPSIVVDKAGRVRHSRPGWHGGFVEAVGAGAGLMAKLFDAARRAGVDLRFGTNVVSVLPHTDGDGWRVTTRGHDGTEDVFEAAAVVLATGGFQADVEWRTECLGAGWDLAKVRGSALNTGAGIRMAFENGARSHGNWSGCHAVAWSVGSGDAGRPDANHVFERESYPFGISVNLEGKRFVDEGSDFGSYTYAKYGKDILRQPEQRAWQIFDRRADDLLTSEYRYKNPEAARIRAESLEGLANALEERGLDGRQFLLTVEEFNRAVDEKTPFSPYEKDGRRTNGLAIDKTNWSNAIEVGPFEAYEITCGITFTFGGVQIDSSSRVVSYEKEPIERMFACGEMVGGLFYFNYPSGCGLTAGAVLGKTAGAEAAQLAAAA